MNFFPNIANLSFTASVEKKFDEITNGNKQWITMIGEFYGGFHADEEDKSKFASLLQGQSLDKITFE